MRASETQHLKNQVSSWIPKKSPKLDMHLGQTGILFKAQETSDRTWFLAIQHCSYFTYTVHTNLQLVLYLGLSATVIELIKLLLS